MQYLEDAKRPWGKYQKLFQEDGIWVKRIEVNAHSRLSLQKHQHRSEKWVIVEGQGIVVIDNKEIPVGSGTSVDIPLGAVHRMANTGDERLVFIEVAFGKYLAEDDIIRLQDDYKRSDA